MVRAPVRRRTHKRSGGGKVMGRRKEEEEEAEEEEGTRLMIYSGGCLIAATLSDFSIRADRSLVCLDNVLFIICAKLILLKVVFSNR